MKTCKKCNEIFEGKQCKACARTRFAEYYAKNSVKINAKIEAYRKANPEKIMAIKAAWVKANPEKVIASRDRNKSKRTISVAEWQAKNPDRVKANGDAYRSANKDKCNAATSAWNEKNKVRRAESKSEWYRANVDRTSVLYAKHRADNKELYRLYKHNRRAKESASGRLSKGLPVKLLGLQFGRCACCRKLLDEKYHLDHIMPIALGGSNTDNNIQLLCPPCNHKKHAKHPVDFMQSMGFLL